MGYTKETIINTLALLGWSTQEEIFSTNDLIANFDIKNVQKGAAIFDLKRMDWISSQHLSNLNNDDFIKSPTLEPSFH